MATKRSLRGCPCKVGASKKRCGIRGLNGKCVPRGTRGLRGTAKEHVAMANEYLSAAEENLKHKYCNDASYFATMAGSEASWTKDQALKNRVDAVKGRVSACKLGFHGVRRR